MERFVLLVVTLLCIYVIFSYAEETKEMRNKEPNDVCIFLYALLTQNPLTTLLNKKKLLTNRVRGPHCKFIRTEVFLFYQEISYLLAAK